MLRPVRLSLPVAALFVATACAEEQASPDQVAAGATQEATVEVLPGQVQPARTAEPPQPTVKAGVVLDAKTAADLIAPLEPGKELDAGWQLREPLVVAEEMQIRIVNGDRFIAVRCMPDDGKTVGVARSKSFVIELGLAGIDHAEAQPLAKQVIDAVVRNDPGGLELPAPGR